MWQLITPRPGTFSAYTVVPKVRSEECQRHCAGCAARRRHRTHATASARPSWCFVTIWANLHIRTTAGYKGGVLSSFPFSAPFFPPPSHSILFLLILILATVVAQRIIVARPLARDRTPSRTPRFHCRRTAACASPASCDSVVARARPQPGRPRPARCWTSIVIKRDCTFAALFPFPRTFPPTSTPLFPFLFF